MMAQYELSDVQNSALFMTIDLPDATFRIDHLVSRHLPQRADHIALMSDECVWTYQQLNAAIDEMATFLQVQGLQAGDRLLIVGESGATQLVAVLACSRLDAWAVILNARMSGAEVD